jgi:hypothetical protein
MMCGEKKIRFSLSIMFKFLLLCVSLLCCCAAISAQMYAPTVGICTDRAVLDSASEFIVGITQYYVDSKLHSFSCAPKSVNVTAMFFPWLDSKMILNCALCDFDEPIFTPEYDERDLLVLQGPSSSNANIVIVYGIANGKDVVPPTFLQLTRQAIGVNLGMRQVSVINKALCSRKDGACEFDISTSAIDSYVTADMGHMPFLTLRYGIDFGYDWRD